MGSLRCLLSTEFGSGGCHSLDKLKVSLFGREFCRSKRLLPAAVGNFGKAKSDTVCDNRELLGRRCSVGPFPTQLEPNLHGSVRSSVGSPTLHPSRRCREKMIQMLPWCLSWCASASIQRCTARVDTKDPINLFQGCGLIRAKSQGG